MPIPPDRTINTVTPEDWANSTSVEQRAFNAYWSDGGNAWFSCLRCGFPTAHGQARCDACDKISSAWEEKLNAKRRGQRQCPVCHGAGLVERSE